jgi:hypothetical protein
MSPFRINANGLILFSFFTLVPFFSSDAVMAADDCEYVFLAQNMELVPYSVSDSQQVALANSDLVEIRDHETKAHDNLDMFSAGDAVLVTKQVKYVTGGSLGLIVEEHLLSPTEIISLKDQSRLFSSHEVLSELTALIREKFNERLASVELESSLVVGPNVVFFADTREARRLYLKYDYLKKSLSLIGSSRFNSDSPRPFMRSLNSNRFVLAETSPTQRASGVFEIIDLETNKKVSFKFSDSHKAYIKLSADGDTFSVTYHDFAAKTQENLVYAIDKSQWQDDSVPKGLSEFKLLRQFQGKMLGADSKLQVFVVDESRNVREIEPVMLDFSNEKPKRSLLSGWPQMRKKLREATQNGLNLDFTETKSELSADGNHFSLRVRLYHGESRTQLVKDLFFLWNLQSHTPPRVVTSEDLDTVMSSEPNANNYANSLKGIAWARQTASRLLDDGTLLIARSLVQKNKKDITVDIVKVREDDPFLPVQTGIITGLNLDPYGENNAWRGVTQLQISPSGNKVAVDITGVGIRVIKVK